MKTEIVKKSDALIKFGNAKQEIAALALTVSEVEINDATSLQIATNISIKLNTALISVDKKRKELKEPSMIEGRLIDSLAKELSEDGKKAIKIAKDKILEYHSKVKEIKAEEMIEESENNQFPLDAATIVEAIQSEKISGVRKSWDWALDSLSKVPNEWLCVDQSIVDAYMKQNKDNLTDGCIINGIRFFQKESVVLR